MVALALYPIRARLRRCRLADAPLVHALTDNRQPPNIPVAAQECRVATLPPYGEIARNRRRRHSSEVFCAQGVGYGPDVAIAACKPSPLREPMNRPAPHLLVAAALALCVAMPAAAGPRLVEPKLHVARAVHGEPARVALTFDACMGKIDMRILDVLVREKIPATIFVTARWLRKNPQASAVLLAHPGQFDIENHGAMHVPAVDYPASVYGITAAGSPEAVMP